MKKVLITMEITCSDEYYNNEMKEWLDGVASGNSQKELEKETGITKVSATHLLKTIEEIKP